MENEKIQELQKLTERIDTMTRENHEMIRKLYHAMVWGRIMRGIYLLLILSVMFGTYYYIQPYIGPLIETYSGAQNLLGSLKNAAP